MYKKRETSEMTVFSSATRVAEISLRIRNDERHARRGLLLVRDNLFLF